MKQSKSDGNSTPEYHNFLIRYISELEQEKRNLNNQLEEQSMRMVNLVELNNKIKQNKDQSYNYFSPMQENDKAEQDELRIQEKTINEQKAVLESRKFSIIDQLENFKRIEEEIRKYKFIIGENAKSVESNNESRYNWGLKVLETQEEDRKRIARELHDTTVQDLTTFIHKTELCSKLVDIDTIRVKLELKTMIDSIHETINDMRNIIYDLRPMSIDDLGLSVTMERYIGKLRDNSYKTKISYEVRNKEIALPPVITLTIFRIIQEACNNAVKYADAENIDILVAYNNNHVEIVVVDNGNGFLMDQVENKIESGNSGFGLSIMRERTYLLTGEIEIISELGQGTKIVVRVPYLNSESEVKYEIGSNKDNNRG